MEKRIFGYARVSSKEQNLDRQVLALKKYVGRTDTYFALAKAENKGIAGKKSVDFHRRVPESFVEKRLCLIGNAA